VRNANAVININAKIIANVLSPLLDCIKKDIGIEIDNVAAKIANVFTTVCPMKILMFFFILLFLSLSTFLIKIKKTRQNDEARIAKTILFIPGKYPLVIIATSGINGIKTIIKYNIDKHKHTMGSLDNTHSARLFFS